MEENSPKLLNLMTQQKEYLINNNNNNNPITTTHDEEKLELKLGLPSEQDWQNRNTSLNPVHNTRINIHNNGGGRIACGQVYNKHCCTRISDLQKVEIININNTAVTTNNKRAAPTPVVGWPPIRSFRKNLASSISPKTGAEPCSSIPSKPGVNEKQPAENSNKSLFVKINMDGVPIGRKVDLNACNCYENLSTFVDTLFRGLLTALKDTSPGGTENKQDEQKPITGLMDSTGEYTLVYEDNEGDMMLAGDVPWNMFVSTVKRIRVLKTADLPALFRGSKQGKMMVESASK